MHELAIAQQLIDTATAALPITVRGPVRTMRVRLGPLAGVLPDELRFGFSVASAGTRFAGAQLEIIETPVVVYCADCQTKSTLAAPIFALSCPVCEATGVRLVQGKDLTLASFEVADETATV